MFKCGRHTLRQRKMLDKDRPEAFCGHRNCVIKMLSGRRTLSVYDFKKRPLWIPLMTNQAETSYGNALSIKERIV